MLDRRKTDRNVGKKNLKFFSLDHQIRGPLLDCSACMLLYAIDAKKIALNVEPL